MIDHELEIFFPDNYEYRVQIQRIEYEITLLNISSLCHMANQQFEYLSSNKKKSGLYFVDWRINYWNLNDFILINENVKKVLYHSKNLPRFEIFTKDNNASNDLILASKMS